MNELSPNFLSDIAVVNGIEAVPTILQVVCQSTGHGIRRGSPRNGRAMDRLFRA